MISPRPVIRRVKSATAGIATIATLTTFNIFIFRFSILYDRLARCYTTDRLSAKVRLVERVRRFKELTDENPSECLKMTSGLDWPCSGSEFILSKAEETLRYAVEKGKTAGEIILGLLVCPGWALPAPRAMTKIEQFSVSDAKLRTALPRRRPKDRTLVVVTDQTEIEGVLQAGAKKYPQLKVPANATVHVFHVVG